MYVYVNVCVYVCICVYVYVDAELAGSQVPDAMQRHSWPPQALRQNGCGSPPPLKFIGSRWAALVRELAALAGASGPTHSRHSPPPLDHGWVALERKPAEPAGTSGPTHPLSFQRGPHSRAS